jgi:hypothetical protein
MFDRCEISPCTGGFEEAIGGLARTCLSRESSGGSVERSRRKSFCQLQLAGVAGGEGVGARLEVLPGTEVDRNGLDRRLFAKRWFGSWMARYSERRWRCEGMSLRRMSASTRTQKRGEIVACEKVEYDRQGRGQ